MSEASTIPYRIFPSLFWDNLQYRGPDALPGSSTLPEHWSLVSGSATTNSGVRLEFNEPSIIEYSGESLEDLAFDLFETVDGVRYSNFAISTEFWSDSGLDLSLRSRIEGGSVDDYVSLQIDVDNNRFRLIETVDSTSSSFDYGWTSHEFDLGLHYSIMLWCFRNYYYVYINGQLATSETANLGSSFLPPTLFVGIYARI